MGSYTLLKLGGFTLWSDKGEINPLIMTLFTNGDRFVEEISSPKKLKSYGFNPTDFEEGESIRVVQYKCSHQVALDRLELMGYTLKSANDTFNEEITSEMEYEREQSKWTSKTEFNKTHKERIKFLSNLSLKIWLEGLAQIRKEKLYQSRSSDLDWSSFSPLLCYMLRDSSSGWYGFPNCDLLFSIRLLLEICEKRDFLIYDLTEIAHGYEYSLSDIDDEIAHGRALINEEFSQSQKIIVLVEGNSDKRVVERTLKLFHPHLFDYFRFLDLDEMRIGGGVGNLANLVKAFAGVEIVNRVIALFDNDTAAESSILTLRELGMPDNIVVLKYPDVAIAMEYPTLGPSGVVKMDVNGLAASIELYFGRDVLTCDRATGELTPIQWKGFDVKLRKYQGEILNKKRLHEIFLEKLRRCEVNPRIIKKYDWTGIQAILKSMIEAFNT
jgi:hypothetical protein